jgi:4-amino-4-deoxy-L-arabinose transferase-like glycosyltransferase
MSGRPPRALDQLIGCALALGYIAVLLGTANDIGLARDEGIYVDAGERYGAWLQLLFHAPSTALERAQIDNAFHINHEHPPLMKLLFGLGHWAQTAWHSSSAPSLGFRFAGMLSAGLLLWLLYVFGTRLYGRTAGLFAALCYALLPRPFYHAHLCAFDVPITLASTAATYAYYRSLTSLRWAPLAGLVFGLALLTKHNSWILPGIFALHFALCVALSRWLRTRPQLSAAATQRVRGVPFGLIAMLLLGPLVFFAGWPWLWHDTLARLRDYAAFHLHHEYYNMEYFGVNYFWPPFPSSYAWVMTLFTVPFTSLALGVCGAVLELKRTRDELRGEAPLDATLPSVLLLGALLAPLVIISIPSTPIFGGTKHWFPAYPMLALFAGRAFSLLADWLAERTRRALATRWIAAAWLLAPALVETAHSHPFALSHYTVIAGGVPGAAEKGMNRQFWGFTTRSLVPYLRAVLPEGGTLYICDTIYGAFLQLIRDGHLPASFRATGDIARADYAVVHHEKHFAEVDHEIWTTYGNVQPAHVLLYDGVPIISVYKNPRAK